MADLHLEGQTSLDPATVLDDAIASGRVDLVAAGLALPGRGSLDGRGELAITLERRQLDAVLRDLTAELDEVAAAASAAAALMPAPWRVALREPIGIRADFRGDEVRLEGGGRIAITSAGPEVVVAGSAALTMDAGGRIGELVLPDGQIELRDLAWAGMRVDRAAIRLDGAGTPETWQGTVDVELAGAGEPWPGLTLGALTLRHDLEVRFADGRLTVAAREVGEVAAQVAWQKKVQSAISIRLEAAETPLLTAGLETLDWQAALRASVPALEITATVGQEPLRATGVGRLTVDLDGRGAGLTAGRIGLDGGRLELPAYALDLSGIAGEVALAGSGLDLDRPIPVTIGSIVHGGQPAWFAPLRLAAELRPAGDRIGFEGRLGRPGGDAEVRLSGEHDLARGAGRAEVDLPPLEFAAGRLQPGRLAPVLGEYLEDVSGRMAMDGTLRWTGAGQVDADLDLLLEGLAFTSGPARFEQVNGIVTFDRVLPLATPPRQQLAVGLLDFGLPLTDGTLSFQLEPEPALAVEGLTWRFAGGRVRADPFRIGSAAAGFTTVLEAEGLDLGQLFALTRLDGLSGKGTIGGALPLEVNGSEAVVRGGELIAKKPGWLRYRPGAAPTALQAGGDNVGLLLEALENFRYESLRITLDGRTDAEMDIGLHITGANPELYDGYPIEFNLNLEGELANILRSGLASYQIPERIGKRMLQFGR